MFLTNYLINLLNFNFFKNQNLNNKNTEIFFKKNLSFKKKFIFLKFFSNLNENKSYLYLFIYNLNFINSTFLNILFALKFKLISNNNQIFVSTNFKNSYYFYLNFFYNSNNQYISSNFFFLKINSLFNFNKFTYLLKNSFNIKFSISDFFKYINNNSLNYINILFLRKNKIFNKGRYSRNRQYYRTGVYWCLYVNIIAVVGIYFWFYRFNMNFGYLWWMLYFFIFSLFFSRSYSLNVFGLNASFKQVYSSFIWFFKIIYSFFLLLKNYFAIYFK